MDGIVVSAPGKVILHGEHAVVYGKTALAASLNLRTFMKVKSTTNGQLTVVMPNIQLRKSWDVKQLRQTLQLPLCNAHKPEAPSEEVVCKLSQLSGLGQQDTGTRSLAVVACLYLYTAITGSTGELPSLELSICSHLPVGAGLGSSAAFGACLAAGLLTASGTISASARNSQNENVAGHQEWSDKKDIDLINQWAFQSEKLIHGRPSGIDNSVSTYGGAIAFQAGKITPLDKMPKLRILLLNTKVARSTKLLVEQVRERHDKYPNIFGPVLDSIEAISDKCKEVFSDMSKHNSESHYQILNDLIEMNQQHLTFLGVDHPALQQVCQAARSHGLRAKLTGAGGGGCAFALLTPGTSEAAVDKVKQEVASLGYECFETCVGVEGVTQHLSLNGSFKVPPGFQ